MDSVRPPWKLLGSAEELEDLMQLFGGFHDSCLREVHVATGHYVEKNLWMHADCRTTVRMLIQRQFHNPSAIELRFAEVVELHVSPPPPNCESVIYEAPLFVRDGIFYWAENAGWDPQPPAGREKTWIAARRAWWRDASDWVGPRLRYAVDSAGPEGEEIS